MSKIEDDFKKYSEYPEISGPMPYMDLILPKNDAKQVLQNMATAAQQKNQLLQDSAKRNQVDINKIEDFLCENYLQEDSTEYLVDGAILTCTNSTSQEVWIGKEDGKQYRYTVPDDAILEEVIIPSLAVPKVLGCLKVTENPKAKDNDLHYATVCDSKAGDNIPYFGNCKRLPDSEWEMAKFTEGCTKTQGTCQYLMRLEKEWENFDIGKEYLQFTDDVHGAKSGITMTSVLFCKHGGFIYPVTSGQVIQTDGITEEEFILDQTDPESIKQYMWKFFRDAGFSEIAVAGILGNVYVESGGFDPASNRNDNFYGLFQYGGNRKEDFLDASNKWARENETTAQEAWMDVRFQCEYALQDYYCGTDGWQTKYIQRADGSVLEASKENFENAQSIEDAVLAWGVSYERCITKDGFYITEDGHKIRTEIQGQDSRLDAAQKIYDDFTAK